MLICGPQCRARLGQKVVKELLLSFCELRIERNKLALCRFRTARSSKQRLPFFSTVILRGRDQRITFMEQGYNQHASFRHNAVPARRITVQLTDQVVACMAETALGTSGMLQVYTAMSHQLW